MNISGGGSICESTRESNYNQRRNDCRVKRSESIHHLTARFSIQSTWRISFVNVCDNVSGGVELEYNSSWI